MYGKSRAYQATQVSTVSKSKLILLMYDGAIRFINEAKQKMISNDIAGRGMSLTKAQKIVDELNSALDKRAGGEVAENLEKVYLDVTRNLTTANIKGDTIQLDKALVAMKGLRKAWEHVINKSTAPVEQPVASQGVSVGISL